MSRGCSLPANGRVLLGIETEKLIEIPTRPAETRHLCIVVSRQSKGGVFRVFCDIGFTQLLYIQFSFVIVPELGPKMKGEKGNSSASLDKLTGKFQILSLIRHAIQTHKRDFDLFVSTSLIVGGVEKILYKQVRRFEAEVKQISATSSFKVGNTCLDE